MDHQFKSSEFSLIPSEIKKLIDCANKKRDKLIVSLLSYTGIRRAELRDINISDINAFKKRITIRKGKGGKQRIVFYPEKLQFLINDFLDDPADTSLIKGRKGRALSLRSINNIVSSVGYLSGIKNPNPRYINITPHLLRHSFARNWKRKGGSLESLQKILGHASMQTTLDLYGTEGLEETEENYVKMSKIIFSTF